MKMSLMKAIFFGSESKWDSQINNSPCLSLQTNWLTYVVSRNHSEHENVDWWSLEIYDYYRCTGFLVLVFILPLYRPQPFLSLMFISHLLSCLIPNLSLCDSLTLLSPSFSRTSSFFPTFTLLSWHRLEEMWATQLEIHSGSLKSVELM